jgi:pSer/pThr/pTyr-binding forkhead associated (FHA) protein
VLKFKVRKHGADFKELDLDSSRDYVVGRAPNCDIVLEDLPGISRQHFKMEYVEGHWQINVLSKFGNLTKDGDPVTHFSLSVQQTFKLAPYDFMALETLEELFKPEAEPQTGSKELALIHFNSAPEEDPQSENEVTSIVVFKGVPYLRISGPDLEQNEILRLEGKSWVIGRDEACSVILKDSTASRKQFRIDYENLNYYISDLASANGTLLNGAQILGRHSLKSGDIISVQSLTIHFELRDPSFKERLQGISENIINAPALVIDHGLQFQDQRSMPVYSGDGGAVPLHYQDQSHQNNSKPPPKKILIYAVLALLLVGGAFMFTSGTKNENVTQATSSPKLEHLTQAQKNLVEDSYNLANNFILQGKFANAQAQLTKIAEIIGDEAYKDSRALQETCQAAIDNEVKIATIEAQRKRTEEDGKRVSEVLFQCNKLSQTSTSEEQIALCLQEAINLDPESQEIRIQKDRVHKRVMELNEQAGRRAEYQAKLAKARELYNRARNLEDKGEYLKAIEAYEKVIAASLPDPENHKQDAQRKIASIKQNLSQKSEEFINQSQKFAEQNNLKDALGELVKAQKVDINNTKIMALTKKYRQDLDSQLQELFSEATIYEGNSRIERSLELWKKIIELDRPDGNYYKKSKSKLTTYGSH